jgi:hypothetical protein
MKIGSVVSYFFANAPPPCSDTSVSGTCTRTHSVAVRIFSLFFLLRMPSFISNERRDETTLRYGTPMGRDQGEKGAIGCVGESRAARQTMSALNRWPLLQ